MRLLLSIGWLIFLGWAMLSPGTSFPEVDLFDFQDKAIHWIVFMVQVYLWSGVGTKSDSRKVWINFLVFGLLPSIGFEYLQQFIPYRSFDYLDMIVNVLGAFTGIFTYFKWPSIKMILE